MSWSNGPGSITVYPSFLKASERSGRTALPSASFGNITPTFLLLGICFHSERYNPANWAPPKLKWYVHLKGDGWPGLAPRPKYEASQGITVERQGTPACFWGVGHRIDHLGGRRNEHKIDLIFIDERLGQLASPRRVRLRIPIEQYDLVGLVADPQTLIERLAYLRGQVSITDTERSQVARSWADEANSDHVFRVKLPTRLDLK